MSVAAPLNPKSSVRPVRPGSAGSWLAFSALAVYGTLRWGTMLGTSEQGRLFASLLLALFAAALLRGLGRHPPLRWVVVPLVIASVVALLGIAGFPLSTHLGRIASRLSDGAGTFGNLLVPYTGGDANVAATLVLAAGLLLLGAGVAFGSAQRPPSTVRLALAAGPLLALAVIPSTIVEPRLPYLHGFISFILVALLVFSPRLSPGTGGSAMAVLSLAAVIGAVGAGVIAGDRLWVGVHHSGTPSGTGSGTAVPAAGEQFNWRQTYSTLGWPYTGASVLEITARHPAHWKAEDLDTFNGTGWTEGHGGDGPGLQGVSAAHLAAYSETLDVNVDQISSNQIIGAGYAYQPDLQGVASGSDPGTWISSFPLQPGDDYSIRVYAPDPPASQLAVAGADYPSALAPFRTLNLPGGAYADVQALADRLHAGTATPYAYTEAVLDYLQHGYVYTLDPPKAGAYPLVDFLLHSRRGYCQAFAGAMALLLRMESVPARVAVGFSTGERRAGSHTYVVADSDAHAWVEVWFPGFGWVTFDPTPGTATAAGASPAAPATPTTAAQSALTATPTESTTTPTSTSRLLDHLASGQNDGADTHSGSARHNEPGRTLLVVALALIGLILTGLLAVTLRAFWRRPSTTELTRELERAFAVSGQPLEADVTLADIERLLGDSPAAAAYVGALSAARYGASGGGPTAQGRAALRRWLAQGGGRGAWLRALRALPPRRRPTAV